MNIQKFEDYREMSSRAAQIFLNEINKKKDLLICAPTGNSPLGFYQSLALSYSEQPNLFNELRILKLDEWVGISDDDPGSCEYFLQKILLGPLKISGDRYFGFNPNTKNAEHECQRMQAILKKEGFIDLCVLGLGRNGHIGFNEPAQYMQTHCHVVPLSEESKKHTMVEKMTIKPALGMTLGMKDILSSRRIILLVCGEGKDKATEMLLSKKITNQFPATYLWLHKNVDCLMVS